MLVVHSLSKRSNMAGLRAGFIAGDRDLVTYLGEMRKHGGLMMPSPIQAAAAAALGDDEHVREQQARYARRRALALPALESRGLVHDGGSSTFYLWLRDADRARDGWAIAEELATTGLVVAPGDFYGSASTDHVRVALTLTDDADRPPLREGHQIASPPRLRHSSALDASGDATSRAVGRRGMDASHRKRSRRPSRALWEGRDDLFAVLPETEARAAVLQAVELLDTGEARVAEMVDGDVVVHEWLKYAVLLLFRLSHMETIELGPFEYADKIPLKHHFQRSGVRVVPGASARWGSYLAPGAVMMPSYVNIGARVGADSMVDTWATVGSCAQIGERVHLSGGVGIGGVLEPPQAAPVMVGDDSMIGSRCIVAEGARVGNGVVLGAGAILTGSIPVIDAETGDELSRGIVPDWCVAISATRTREYAGGTFGLPCVLVVKRLEEGERHDKSKLNDILRDHGAAT